MAEIKSSAKPQQAEPAKKEHQLFGEVSNPSFHVGTRKWYTLPLSIVAHVVVIGLAVIVPLMAFDA
ncbi:MAG TPA: hypothetical protein EYO94_13595, partial [Acidobacteria bacterium]|nr:hypothetical protein [Acidobacteriota bacterium]